MENVSTSQMISEHLGRWLDNPSSVSDEETLRNRILYIVYLCVLGCCCITPCLYYIRLSAWQRRQFREFREMERNAIIAALAQSTTNSNHRMNTSAELAIVQSERRARILQLMEPVRMTLEEKHFQRSPLQPNNPSNEKFNGYKSQSPPTERNKESDDMTPSLPNTNSISTEELTIPSSLDSGFDFDEESILIQIPCPGLHVRTVLSSDGSTTLQSTARTNTRRSVPGFCTICLSAFELGHDIVWSSNSQCDHCFHTDCMQQWLTKHQRGSNAEGPVCPCCRRDFVVDPYDLITVQSPIADGTMDPNRCITGPNSPVDTDDISLTCPMGDDEIR